MITLCAADAAIRELDEYDFIEKDRRRLISTDELAMTDHLNVLQPFRI
ncbi:hypothetical protein MPTA5024_13490 [Microbispora sp. ATCC PTA-5024]|nr:hypothetical protein MPTA5024_13490 [Microbispora sp. ATCC PTA-5024]